MDSADEISTHSAELSQSMKEFGDWYDNVWTPQHLHLSTFDLNVFASIKNAAWLAWQESRKPASKKINRWQLELMFKKRGERLPRTMDFGVSTENNHREAVAEGKKRADEWLVKTFKKDEIESWNLTARPANK